MSHTARAWGDTPIKTIGEMKEFINAFSEKADGYPFLVAAPEVSHFDKVTACKVKNVGSHPDYIMLIVEEPQ